MNLARDEHVLVTALLHQYVIGLYRQLRNPGSTLTAEGCAHYQADIASAQALIERLERAREIEERVNGQ